MTDLQTLEPPTRGGRGNITVAVAAIAVAAGIAIRWYHLGEKSLWFDEGFTAWMITLPVSKIIATTRVDTAPPLYYLLLKVWALVLGRSEAALRAMSAACATAALLLFVPVSHRLLRDRLATSVAITLFALGYFQVAYAHDARFYPLMTLETVAALWAVLRAIDRPGPGSTALVAFVWTAGVYTSNLMAVYGAMTALAWLILPGPSTLRTRWVYVAAAGAITVLFYAPWLPTVLAQSRYVRGHFWIPRPRLRGFVRALSALSGFNERGIDPLFYRVFYAMGLLLTCCVFVTMLDRRTRRTSIALACVGLAPMGLVFTLSRIGQPIFVERAMIASSVLLPMILALPAALGRWPGRAVLAVGVILAMVDVRSWHEHWGGEYPEDWRAACRYAAAERGPNGRAIFVGNEGELLYDYYIRHSDYTPSPEVVGAPIDFFAVDPPRTLRQVSSDASLDPLRRMLDDPTVSDWTLVEAHLPWADANHRVEALLGSRFRVLDKMQFKQVTVYRFAR